jgi:hypothetical protein
MQTSVTRTPFSAAAAAARPQRLAAPVASAAPRDDLVPAAAAAVLPRRALAGMLAAAPVLFSAASALALIPDDDDEDLIEKARANRKSRLANEKAAEKDFARSEGFVDRSLEKSLVAVQLTINALAATGAGLSAGDLTAASSALGFSLASDFEAAAKAVSDTDDLLAKASAAGASLTALQRVAGGGSLVEAKKGFISAVDAVEVWAAAAGVKSALKGL